MHWQYVELIRAGSLLWGRPCLLPDKRRAQRPREAEINRAAVGKSSGIWLFGATVQEAYVPRALQPNGEGRVQPFLIDAKSHFQTIL